MKCEYCHTEFKPNKMKAQRYCGWICYKKALDSLKKPVKYCKVCNAELTKRWSISFCSRSCATTYNNKNKKTGTRRSNLEKYIEKVLSEQFSKEEIIFNSKELIGSELDIYFPNLNLAVEINGPFHYRPIYGEEKLQRIQNLDAEKKLLCEQNNIELLVIDTSKQLQFSESNSKPYIDIILNTVNKKKLTDIK